MTFKTLTIDETKEYRKWAQDNYKPFDVISECWHPIVRMECYQINIDELRNIYSL